MAGVWLTGRRPNPPSEQSAAVSGAVATNSVLEDEDAHGLYNGMNLQSAISNPLTLISVLIIINMLYPSTRSMSFPLRNATKLMSQADDPGTLSNISRCKQIQLFQKITANDRGIA
jgi:hypothetical protein